MLTSLDLYRSKNRLNSEIASKPALSQRRVVFLSPGVCFRRLPSLSHPSLIFAESNLSALQPHPYLPPLCTWGLSAHGGCCYSSFPPAWTLQGPAPPPPQRPRSSPPHPAPATTSLCPPLPTPVPQTSMHIAPGKWQPEPKLLRWGFDFKSQERAKSYLNVVLRFRIHEVRRQSTKYFPGLQIF